MDFNNIQSAPGPAEPLASTDALVASALAPVTSELQLLQEQIVGLIPTQTETSKSVINHVLGGGGKRIRPALYFFSARLVGYNGPHLIPIAAVCEFVHTASLLHDDVVDNSTLRRNKPTANSIWGDEASVLVGDLIYARSSELMAETGLLEFVSTFARAIRMMSEGELLQLEQVFASEASEEKYLQIINHKTAVLIAASCRAASILGGCTLDQRDALSEFGICVGTAFQLVDDALDYLGAREVFGKPTLSDLQGGKVTLPVIMLREVASPTEQQELAAILNSTEITDSMVQTVAQMVDKYHTAVQTIERARALTDRARQALTVFADSDRRRDLENIAEQLVWRFN